MADGPLALEEQRARINRAQEETRNFIAERHKLTAEQHKLNAEAAKLRRDLLLAPWRWAITGFAAGVLVTGALVALLLVFGHYR